MGITEKGSTWDYLLSILLGCFFIVGFTQMLFIYYVTNCMYSDRNDVISSRKLEIQIKLISRENQSVLDQMSNSRKKIQDYKQTIP